MMSQPFVIEKGVQVQARSEHSRKYPFNEMDIGDSFAIPGDLMTSVRSAATAFGRDHSQKFTVRKDGDGGRCWRIA